MPEENVYDANFTAGGLLHHEFIALEKVILGNAFEEALKLEESQNQFVGIKTIAARKRVLAEVKRRVLHVPEAFWNQFYQWSEKEQKLALLYVCLKTYRLVFDIHWEVSLNKFKTGSALDAYSVSMFLDELASKDDYVAHWSSSTMYKLNVQYRKALKDSGLLTKAILRKPLGIPESFWTFFKTIDESWWMEACFVPNNIE